MPGDSRHPAGEGIFPRLPAQRHPRNLAFMKCRLFCSLLLLPLSAAQPPNVIIVYSDDQGSVDARCYGTEDLKTPNMDRLAASGVRFTQMLAPSAVCSSSRAGLLTGQFPARAGVPSNGPSEKGKAGMPGEVLTIAELLRGGGYATAHIGKWHLGYTSETMPNAQGFDWSFGHMGGCIDNYSHFFYWDGPNRHDLWRNGKEVWEDGVYFGVNLDWGRDSATAFNDRLGEDAAGYQAFRVVFHLLKGEEVST